MARSWEWNLHDEISGFVVYANPEVGPYQIAHTCQHLDLRLLTFRTKRNKHSYLICAIFIGAALIY